MTRSSRGAVCVFAKPPRAGLVKTRLGAGVGMERAAELARAFLRDSFAALGSHPGVDAVLATTEPAADFGPLGDGVIRVDQGQGDLGARIERVLRGQLAHRPWAIALGADSPGLPADRLAQAVRALEGGHAVLGPTEDGGFYLLGLVRCPRGLLADLPWSSADTARSTWARLARFGLDPVRLAAWFDIDSLADLERFRARVPRQAAPATWAILDRAAGTLGVSEDP